MIIAGRVLKDDISAVHVRRIYRSMRCAGTSAWLARSYIISMLRATRGFK